MSISDGTSIHFSGKPPRSRDPSSWPSRFRGDCERRGEIKDRLDGVRSRLWDGWSVVLSDSRLCFFLSSHSINLAATDLGSGNFKISIVVDRQVFNYFNTYFNCISPKYGYKFPQKNPIYLSHRFPDISHGFSHGFPDFPWISHGFSENSARMGIPNLRQKLFLSNEALPLHASWAEPWIRRRWRNPRKIT